MVATRFALAVHMLLLLAGPTAHAPVTSAVLAAVLRTNPVVIRRLSGQLAKAGLIRIRRGPGGASLGRPPANITLALVWSAVNTAARPLLPLHHGADGAEARRVHAVLADTFANAEGVFRGALARVTLADLLGKLQQQAA